MSELKTYNSERIYWAVEQVEREAGDIEDLHLDDTLFYLKSEADEVIVELKKQIEFLKTTHDSCGNCNKCADGMGKVFDKELDKWKRQLRHHKYKRCLDKAAYWLAVSYNCIDYKHRRNAEKNHYRWLDIAAKVKETTNGTY